MTTYGVEMECYVPRNIGQHGVAEALNRLGIRARVSGYGGREYSVWQIKTDCSLSSPPSGYVGIEVVSPVLTWGDDDSAAQLRKVSEYLVAIDARVNSTCGGHVHVHVGNLDANGIANLVESYYQNNAAIEQTFAPSRRGSGWARVRGDWQGVCQSIRDYGTSFVPHIGSHNNAINADWYASRGTFEFRAREGSINHYKITGWVGFIIGLIRAAEDESIGTFTDAESMSAYLVNNEYLTPILRDWFLKRGIPSISSEVIETLNLARAAAAARVSRMFDLQGVR